MGCVCSKDVNPDENGEVQKTNSLKLFVTISKKDEAVTTVADVAINGSHNVTPRLLSKPQQDNMISAATKQTEEAKNKPVIVTDRTRKIAGHQRRATVNSGAHRDGSEVAGVPTDAEATLGRVDAPKSVGKEHVSEGWPSWLTAVAGEAIKGWVPRKANSFEKLDKIGQGTYSSVYKARDLETGKIVALKKVRFVNMDPESVRFMAREIHILRKLDHPNVIKLEGIVASRMSSNLYLVFEYMEHDLAGLAARPGLKFAEPQVKCFMLQLLEGLSHCHSRGVLHRDIKGSNLLIDDNGILKIADFGLATLFNPEKKQQLTSRVVTLWYRPPELLLGATEYGVAVDLWSSGCILAELLAGKPIMPGRTEVEQLHKIFKLCGSPSEEYWKKSKLPHATIFKPQHQYRRCVAETFKEFPPSALSLLDTLLAIEPENRGTAALALKSGFFTTKPFACEPSSLPKVPPSKEYDAKLRDEERRRQKAEAANGQGSQYVKTRRRSKAVPSQDASMDPQKRQQQAHAKSRSGRYQQLEDSVTGFPLDPPEGTALTQTSLHPSAFGSTWNKKPNQEDLHTVPGRSYSSVRVSNGPQLRQQRSYRPESGASDFNYISARSIANSRYNRLDVAEPSEKHILDRPASTHKRDERIGIKDSAGGYVPKNRRIHYSGPLMPPGGNIEDMLKEHERQIQQAVRKARLDKVKSKKNMRDG